MLDTRTATSVSPPSAVAHDAIGSKDRSDQLWNTTIPAIGEHTSVLQAEALDHGSTVVQRVIAVAWPTCGRCDHMQIASANQDLRIPRPAVVLRARGRGVIARWHQRAVDDHDQRRSWSAELAIRASLGTRAATMRCAVDVVVSTSAASSRNVRVVRSAMQVKRTRCGSCATRADRDAVRRRDAERSS